MSFTTAFCSAESVPAPAVSRSNVADFTASYTYAAKDSSLNAGSGADISTTHYVFPHWGFRMQSDYVSADAYRFREYGYRGGLVYRFNEGTNFVPYSEFLAGYSRVTATYLRPTSRGFGFDSGFSYIAGGGADFRVKGALFLRSGVDFVSSGDHTRYGRIVMGISIHPGDKGANH